MSWHALFWSGLVLFPLQVIAIIISCSMASILVQYNKLLVQLCWLWGRWAVLADVLLFTLFLLLISMLLDQSTFAVGSNYLCHMTQLLMLVDWGSAGNVLFCFRSQLGFLSRVNAATTNHGCCYNKLTGAKE
ncbi:hypothetical protein U1Q18_041974 [Sarracenia purpurea var. burkii]